MVVHYLWLTTLAFVRKCNLLLVQIGSALTLACLIVALPDNRCTRQTCRNLLTHFTISSCKWRQNSRGP